MLLISYCLVIVTVIFRNSFEGNATRIRIEMTSTITGPRRYNIMQASEAVYKTQEAHKHMTIFKLKQ